jgi:GrpB-like predicted nucleotidyltransferase (UPF0157 family)
VLLARKPSIGVHQTGGGSPHQPRRAEEFSSIAAKIRGAIGDKAVDIYHIGSTSVPNVGAKNVIDIQVTVADLDEPTEMPITQIGFEPTQIREDYCPAGVTLSPNDLMKRYYRVKDRRINLQRAFFPSRPFNALAAARNAGMGEAEPRAAPRVTTIGSPTNR